MTALFQLLGIVVFKERKDIFEVLFNIKILTEGHIRIFNLVQHYLDFCVTQKLKLDNRESFPKYQGLANFLIPEKS